MTRAVRAVAFGLIVTGLLTLGYAGSIVIDARTYQSAARQQFEHLKRIAPIARTLAEGDLVGEIRVPRLNIAAIVAEGESATVLQRAVGHLTGTALPGGPGNVVLAAHRDTFFRPLRNVRVGDAIRLRTEAGDFDYVVESTGVVGPADLEVLRQTDDAVLTLITCFPFSFIGPAPNRFIVRARRVLPEVP